MISFTRQAFPYKILRIAPCCGEIQRVRVALSDVFAAAKAYALQHHLEDNGSVIQGIAPL